MGKVNKVMGKGCGCGCRKTETQAMEPKETEMATENLTAVAKIVIYVFTIYKKCFATGSINMSHLVFS